MPSIRVLFVLLAVILLFIEVKTTSAASIVKDVDGREKKLAKSIFLSLKIARRAIWSTTHYWMFWIFLGIIPSVTSDFTRKYTLRKSNGKNWSIVYSNVRRVWFQWGNVILWLFSEDDTLENEDGEAMENSWPWHGVEDTSDYSDLSDLANTEKRGSKIKIILTKKIIKLDWSLVKILGMRRVKRTC